MYDIIIIGGGPAGLSAATYARRAGRSVLIIERAAFGGQMTHSPKIENYPAFISISGVGLADAMLEQTLSLGAEVEIDNVTGIRTNSDGTKTALCEGGEYSGRAVIAAVGCTHRRLGIAREEEFIGEGISFCAVCDGAFYKGKNVAVIGGGNSALQEAILLSESCTRVIIVQNLPHLTGEARLSEIVAARGNIEVIYESVADSIIGNKVFEGLRIRGGDGGIRELIVDGIFVAIGLVPVNEPFAEVAELDSRGYFAAGESCTTKTKGLFVAGDCRAKDVRQITTAVADGSVAALAACRYLDSI